MADSMTRPVRILVDGHGGDDAPDMVLDALKLALSSAKHTHTTFGVVGMPDIIRPGLEQRGLLEKVSLVEAAEFITMCESPAVALRRKKQSSMHVGARAIRDGDWDALVSAGNTGALMAVPKLILKTLPGIDRPALASLMPNQSSGCGTFFLDIGANVDCTSDHLVQFAVMGSCYMQLAEGVKSPRVGLLNIGSEDIKGTDVVKAAHARLKESELNFVGNVEGTDLFNGNVDVVVCDGFVGNVALKSVEGVAKLILSTVKKELSSSVVAKMGALMARNALTRVKDAMNPSEHNGAPLLGLNGIVVKSHGSADAYAFACAIDVARREVEADLTARIIETLDRIDESRTDEIQGDEDYA
ncbi:MAG: phosphate acyltransferase [Zetaproteobacteria bacterium CG_4_9_14_3_um_filter_49_83]|nr:MAG: phosphate acyltransferase [Zetaproteobacteria bacterium CG17_big_fil_post_rev_8_21_14_2_50_50_13]PIV29611.1 MAG: phosphate acyltransferase [Zetaproteobacteria bacterium CG02_land_8_20_14_3_00_50_9]PIY54941.1 MAG: phosphate acyltransferase [Zetaproteobacteria bacterium CG_4_10_14_0_8_um_filter_49_80]PJA35315.1 MAG: phosphate acyltransferase [Zetaproteobacteria bacterium CG_4_9_14_3_um_filter_49_83]